MQGDGDMGISGLRTKLLRSPYERKRERMECGISSGSEREKQQMDRLSLAHLAGSF
jgi:hypothetical protein